MRTPILVLTLALLTPAALAATAERNEAFFWTLLGGAAPDALATFHDGRAMPLATAVAEAAARAGGVDLAAIASGAAPPAGAGYAGDVWAIEVGNGPCETLILAPSPVPWTASHPQHWTYGGFLGTFSTGHGATTMILSWSLKAYGFQSETAGFTAEGSTDMYCFAFDDQHFAFPYVSGEAHLNPV